MTNRAYYLLGILAILLGYQLFVAPVLEWQDSEVSRLSRVASEVSSQERLIAERSALSERANRLRSEISSARIKTLEVSDSSLLKAQEKIISSAERFELDMENFEWGERDPDFENASVRPVRARIRIRGSVDNIVDWHVSLMRNEFMVAVDSLSLRALGNASTNEMRGDVTLRLLQSKEVQ